MAHETKNQPQLSQMTMRQYWLSKTKPKQAFRLTRNAFKKLPWNLQKKFIQQNFLLTDRVTG